MKHGNLPRSPTLCKSFIMPYFHVLSYAFSRSKNIATACCRCTKASRTNDSNRTRRICQYVWKHIQEYSLHWTDWRNKVRMHHCWHLVNYQNELYGYDYSLDSLSTAAPQRQSHLRVLTVALRRRDCCLLLSNNSAIPQNQLADCRHQYFVNVVCICVRSLVGLRTYCYSQF